MRFLFSLLLLVILTNLTPAQATSRTDSILLAIEQISDDKKLDAWENWFSDLSKEELPIAYEALDQAYNDAVNIVGQDSALLWLFYRQSNFVGKFQKYGEGNISVQILDLMKKTADSLSKESPHWTMMQWYYRLAYFHYMQVDMDKAEEYYNKALELSKELGDTKMSFTIHKNMGLMKSFLGESEEATEYLNTADSLLDYVTISDKEKYSFYYSKAYVHRGMGQSELADNYFSQILDSIHIFPKTFQARVHTDYASNLCGMGKIDECVRYLEKLKPIFEEDNLDATMLTFAEEYTEALMLAGRYEEGQEWVVKTRIYYMNIQEARRNDQIQEWQTKYETKKKENQIQLLEQEKTISQTRLIIISLVALFGIGILSFLIYRNKNKRKQLALQLDIDRQIAKNRDRLFSSITHDIRTPLALMLAPLERAENNVIDPASKSDIQLARRNGKRLMELFNQILDWNKAEAKALILNPQVGQLDFTFRSLCERYEQQAIEKGIIFHQKVKMPKGQFLLDYDKLDKILSNLIGNAIKFCDTGQGVTLNADFEKKDSKYSLSLIVSDQGPGIAADEQKGLFERYVQGTQGKLKGGTGIGLALVKELVEMMNGDIELQSEIGKGATFKVNLPIEMLDEMSVSVLSNQEDLLSGLDGNGRSDKTLILVVELSLIHI